MKKAKAVYARSLKRGARPNRESLADKLGISRAKFCRCRQKRISFSDIRRNIQ